MHSFFPIIYKVTTCKVLKIKKIIYIPLYQNFTRLLESTYRWYRRSTTLRKHRNAKKIVRFCAATKKQKPGIR